MESNYKQNYRPLSLYAIGLKNYLDGERQRVRHRGLAYDDFVERVRLGVPKSRIAKDFAVTTVTVTYWIEVHEKEQGDATRDA